MTRLIKVLSFGLYRKRRVHARLITNVHYFLTK